MRGERFPPKAEQRRERAELEPADPPPPRRGRRRCCSALRPGSPVQRYIHQKLLGEFLASPFAGAQDEFFFHGAMVSPEVHAQMKRVLQNAARECTELIERDRAAPPSRNGAALVLALRPWGYSGFRPFERQ